VRHRCRPLAGELAAAVANAEHRTRRARDVPVAGQGARDDYGTASGRCNGGRPRRRVAGRRQEFSAALSSATLPILGLAVLLQIVALLARTEAWHLSIEAAGGIVRRRILYRASSMQVLGGVIRPARRRRHGSPPSGGRRRSSARRCRR
jgi:hypothetical protein